MELKTARLVAHCLIALAAAPAAAELTAASGTGFTSSFRTEVAAPQAATWRAITQLPQWWSDEHTWSGKASNMVLELHAGGCWCERWGDGQSVMHGQVVWVQPGRLVRLNAALGPLQELGVAGVLTLVTSAQDGKTFVRLTYRVAGAADAGLDKLAPVVDKVLAEQFQRLLKATTADRAQ